MLCSQFSATYGRGPDEEDRREIDTAAYKLDPDQGEAPWFFGDLVTVKASHEQTGRRFSLTEQSLPGGQATPLHSQPDDETFYVREGKVTFYPLLAQ